MLTDNLYAVTAFGIGLSAPILVWAVTRPRPDALRASAVLFAKVFAAVILDVLAARFVVVSFLQRLWLLIWQQGALTMWRAVWRGGGSVICIGGGGMRQLVVALLVFVALGASLAPARAEDDCGGWFQPSCRELERARAEQAEEDSYNDYLNERAEQDYQDSLYEAAYTAEEWADTYLSAEKAAATYWRNAYVNRDSATGKRIGTLESTTTSEIVRYPCESLYNDALSGGCVPEDRDYDCDELRAWGIVNIPVVKSSQSGGYIPSMLVDWMHLDEDDDGIGCDVDPAEQAFESGQLPVSNLPAP